MMLYILRHATAEEAASGGDDGARKLTERSKEKMRGAAAACGLVPVCVVGGRDRDAHHDYSIPPYPGQATSFIAGRV